MNTKHSIVSAALLLAISFLQIACAENNCAFDSNAFNKARYANNKNITHIEWNDTDKTAKILTRTGQLISIKHWSCNHLGIHAVMLVGPYSEDNFSVPGKYLKNLAAIALDKYEAELVNSYLDHHKINLSAEPQTWHLEDSDYAEFYLGESIAGESLVVEIKYYKN